MNFSNVPDGEFITPGTHNCRVTNAKETTSRGGTPGWEFELRTEGKQKGKHSFWTSEKALPILKQFLRALGFTNEDFNRDIKPSDCVNRLFTGDFEENDNGYAELKKFRAYNKDASSNGNGSSSASASNERSIEPTPEPEEGEDDLPF